MEISGLSERRDPLNTQYVQGFSAPFAGKNALPERAIRRLRLCTIYR
jgi:hypothetical protein